MDTKQVAVGIIIVALLGVGVWWYLSEPSMENAPEAIVPIVPEPDAVSRAEDCVIDGEMERMGVVDCPDKPVPEPVIEPIPEPRSKPVYY